MPEIKLMKISGFRGIKVCLPLNFEKGNTIRSMVIYGRNGTGKSSITDAWEWFHTEKIEHLRREGAGPNSYPNKNAVKEETFVEIDFVNSDLGTIKLAFDNERITRPTSNGDIEKLRSLAPHPCHIRFEDLTRFVYMTKTEKFDALALLMGFMPQVETQKAFRRVLRNLSEKIDDKTKERNNAQRRLRQLVQSEDISTENFINSMNQTLENHEITRASSIDELSDKKTVLNDLVVNDPRTARISLLQAIISILNTPTIDEKLLPTLDGYLASLQSFLSDEQEVSKLLLLDLYEQGDKIVSQLDESGKKLFSTVLPTGDVKDTCLLCGQIFDGDLSSHISLELIDLRKLKQTRDDLEKQRKDTQSKLPQQNSFAISFTKFENILDDLDKSFALRAIKKEASATEENISTIKKVLNNRADYVTQNLLNELAIGINVLKKNLACFEEYRSNSIKAINLELLSLGKDDQSRIKLVEDNSKFGQAIDVWREVETLAADLNYIQQIFQNFKDIVENYVEKSIENVQDRFSIISGDVKTYFEILEKDTEGLKGAVLRLLTEEDRAVELQIDFHGESVYPAYKYLSESQLNSFGLSVFLASAKFFNSNFKFIILDDIINSFDGYKRPRIIELLKREFVNHQVLLLTHNNVWCDRLFEAFPSSIKKRFARWEYNY